MSQAGNHLHRNARAALFAATASVSAIMVVGPQAVFTAGPIANPSKDVAAARLQRYQQDRATCLNGTSTGDVATCLREAQAAYAQSRGGGLDVDTTPYDLNSFKRCEVLRGDDRRSCISRMLGDGNSSGSVAGGGIYRELHTVGPTAPAPPPTTTQAPPMLPAAPLPPRLMPPTPSSTVPPAVAPASSPGLPPVN